MDSFTLDASDWPLIVNRLDDVIALFPLPNDSTGDDYAGLEQLRLANLTVQLLNKHTQRVL